MSFECQFSGNKKAGDKFRDMLKQGKSLPWRQLMGMLTGYADMDTGVILEFFSPLDKWLRNIFIFELYLPIYVNNMILFLKVKLFTVVPTCIGQKTVYFVLLKNVLSNVLKEAREIAR